MSPTPQQTLAAVYDEGAAAYEARWAPALHRHTLDLVAAVPPTASDQPRTVVDVATGSGALVPALTELAGSTGRVVALDRSIGMLQRVDAATPRVQADAAALPLATASADVVVLFLLPDARSAVHEAARVLGPGGWLLAATWGSQLGTGGGVVVREELDRSGAPRSPTWHAPTARPTPPRTWPTSSATHSSTSPPGADRSTRASRPPPPSR